MLFYKKTHIGVDSNTEPPQVDANDLSTRLYSQIFFFRSIQYLLAQNYFKKNNKKKFFNYFCCPRRCTYTILGGFYYIYIYICTVVHSTLYRIQIFAVHSTLYQIQIFTVHYWFLEQPMYSRHGTTQVTVQTAY